MKRLDVYVPIPDLTHPGGSAPNLVGLCLYSMQRAGTNRSVCLRWMRRAARSSYPDLLRLIRDTFEIPSSASRQIDHHLSLFRPANQRSKETTRWNAQ